MPQSGIFGIMLSKRLITGKIQFLVCNKNYQLQFLSQIYNLMCLFKNLIQLIISLIYLKMIEVEAKIQVKEPQDNKSLSYITKIEALKLSKLKIIITILLCIFTAGLLVPILLICVMANPKLKRKILFDEEQIRQDRQITYYYVQDSEDEESILKVQKIITNEAGLYWKVIAHKQRRYFLNIYQLQQQTFPHKAIQAIIPHSDPYQNLEGVSLQKLEQLESIYGSCLKWPNTTIEYIKYRFAYWILFLTLGLFISFFTNYWIPSLIVLILTAILFLVLCFYYYKSQNEVTSTYTVVRNKEKQKIFYHELKVGDLVIFDNKDKDKIIDFKGLLVSCQRDFIVNQQLYTGKFQHIIKSKASFNDQFLLLENSRNSNNSRMINSRMNKNFAANRITTQNIIFQQSRIVAINEQQVGVVVLSNNLIGSFYKATLRKQSSFWPGLQKQYLILSGSLVIICSILMVIASFANKNVGFKAILLNLISSFGMFLPLLLPFFYLLCQLAALTRLKNRVQNILICSSQKIKEVGVAKHLYFGLRQTILVPRRLSFFLTMYQQKNVQYKSVDQFKQLFAHNDSVKSFQYATGCCNDIFKVAQQSQIIQKIEDKKTFQSRLFSDFRWKFKEINRQGNINLEFDIYNDPQKIVKIQLINAHLISHQTKGVRNTVLLRNEQNFNFIITKGDFYPGFQQILEFDQIDGYYDRAAQTLQKKGYLVEYICFKDYHQKRQNSNQIYSSRISNLKENDIQSGFKFAGFCVSEQCIGQKRFDFLRILNQYGYNIKIVTNDSKNTEFVNQRCKQLNLKVNVMGRLNKQTLSDVLQQDKSRKLMVGNGVYSQQGLYQSDISYAINPSQFENVCHVHFQDLLAEGRCSILMLFITIKIILLREFGQFIGQIYLLSQNYTIQINRNLMEDLIFLFIPMILMNLPRPRNLNRYAPKQTLLSSLSVVEFSLSAAFLVGCFVSAYLYGSLTFPKQIHANHLSYFHLGRIYFPNSAKVHQPDTMTIDMITNGFSIALLLTLDKRQFWRQWKTNLIASNLVRFYLIGLWIFYNFLYLLKESQANRFVYIIDFFIIAMWTIDFFVDQKFQLAVKDYDEIQKQSIIISERQSNILGISNIQKQQY